jgi:HIV Tat-specific factor 1
MHGRHFGGQQVIASIADGSEKFRKSGERKAGIDDDDEEEDERLDRFGEWLESEKKQAALPK